MAKGEQIIALPTLVRKQPGPLRKVIGSTVDKEKLMAALDLLASNSAGNG